MNDIRINKETFISTLQDQKKAGDDLLAKTHIPDLNKYMDEINMWNKYLLTFLEKSLTEGKDSSHYKDFTGELINPIVCLSDDCFTHYHAYKAGLESQITKIKQLIGIQDLLEFCDLTNDVTSVNKIREPRFDLEKVFIVHGHDDALKLDVARFVEKLGLEAIILHEQSSNGRTIIEKIEANTNVGFGIVLYSPCDVGGKVNESLNDRARQNVVFEHGYLTGKLGRENVAVIVTSDSIEVSVR